MFSFFTATGCLIFFFVVSALAAKPLEHEVCAASCYYSLLKIKYANENETLISACTNPLRVTSTYYCIGIHCGDDDIKPGIEWWAGTCKKSKKLVNLSNYHSTIANTTEELLENLQTVDMDENEVINRPAVPSKSSCYRTKKIQLLRYLADRLGALLSSTIPLLFLFAGRNNIFLFLTGWSYKVFSVFHRWIGIVMLVEAIVHGSIFSAYEVNNSGWGEYHASLADDPIWKYGIMMGVALGLTVTISIRTVRDRAYELFKTTHVVLAAIILAALYQHIKGQFAGKYKIWVWLTVAIWCTDHASRLTRLLLLNYKIAMGKGVPATASYSEETGVIRLQVHPSTTVRGKPGTYYYLSISGWKFWESHPFSLAGWSQEGVSPVWQNHDEALNLPREKTSKLREDNPTFLTFLIRPRQGMTRDLRDTLTRVGFPNVQRLRILLEGPYGNVAPLGKFRNILFVAGGSGITAVLPYLRDILDQNRNHDSRQNVRLCWVSRSESLIRDVLANDFNVDGGLSTGRLKIDFFVTSAASGSESSATNIPDGKRTTGQPFTFSRPDVRALVGDFTKNSQGRVAVFTCGPEGLSDETRAAVREQLQNGTDVELFEEMYGW
ncbi:hypothetical protein FDECE_938 [Fusarium decemcellulare]|nr:hypothetical protein FDECE_938 [Fusarium decemcellulare]